VQDDLATARKVTRSILLTFMSGDTKPASCANRKRNRLPKAVNSYCGWGSQTSALACRKWPLWCLCAVENRSTENRKKNFVK